ncbi:MDR family oxidoreductase [Rubrivirga sp. S365]|uniref:MDR family oxidoreductase n=1 Tax=Rubrivirga sp. S365 TaxID=3076080 RepID=UPI0028C861BC|nr:MDR family oxidoreductase [Rubrivirga sp. S365]MDT7856978.1 MDR family oxidoreductase [Rubrivirga sp. S365]
MRALRLHKTDDGIDPRLEDVPEGDLPEGEVLLDVTHSSLNYKDGLAVSGRGKIVRGAFPFVPGIDLAGTVVDGGGSDWAPGDRVVLTGWGTGEDRWGGYAERARASADHLVRLPDGLSAEDAMWIGTAGLTAMLSVLALEDHGVDAGDGPVAVTGASGGVGSTATALLADAGYAVSAVTGTESAHDYLRALGAADVVGREALATPPEAPMGRGMWAGAVDSVGGTTLASLLATTKRHGCVAACGLAGGAALETTVFPFILRGVTLAGIDSNTAPPSLRDEAWARLADAVGRGALGAVERTVISLGDVPAWAGRIVDGDTVGRVVVDVRA